MSNNSKSSLKKQKRGSLERKEAQLAGILIAGDGKLILCQLRDFRFIRKPKQIGLPQKEQSDTTELLNSISENPYPEMYEKFLDLVESGEEIEVVVKEKPKVVVECDFLD